MAASVLFALLYSIVYPTVGNHAYSAVVALLTVVVFLVASGNSDGDAWDAIPRRDYLGRYAELGGLAREEQEVAVEDVRDKAEEIDPRHRDR